MDTERVSELNANEWKRQMHANVVIGVTHVYYQSQTDNVTFYL